MIKGVNRRVVEVNEPDSAYFERVLFFVKAEYCDLNSAKLEKKADELIKKTSQAPKNRYRTDRPKIANFLQLALSAGAGAAVSAIIAALVNQ